ncbi:MAG: hypothetical protein ACJ75F_02840 [Flavisolibacter sp.]
MELSVSPNFWVFKFFKNAKERDLKIADYLDQTVEEASNVARIWETVAESILQTGSAEADANLSWSRLIERPEWTIYSKNIPKSRLEMFFERISSILTKNQRNGMDYVICRIGNILQKRKLTKDVVEEELKRIKEPRFFNRNNRIRDELMLQESVVMIHSEVAAISHFAKQFRSNLVSTKIKKEPAFFASLYKMLFLKKITEDHLLAEFREKYISVSGLNVPEDFLKKRTVYAAFNLKNRMCGGFVLGSITPYRTIEVFAGEESKKKLYDFVEGDSYCELNCFWLSVKSRKGFWGYWFWLLFAFKVSMQREKMLIYGTIAKSLADIYGYPKKSKLLHKDELMFDGKMRSSWIFIGARTDFFIGVLETFIYKFKNNGKKPVRYKRVTLPANAA